MDNESAWCPGADRAGERGVGAMLRKGEGMEGNSLSMNLPGSETRGAQLFPLSFRVRGMAGAEDRAERGLSAAGDPLPVPVPGPGGAGAGEGRPRTAPQLSAHVRPPAPREIPPEKGGEPGSRGRLCVPARCAGPGRSPAALRPERSCQHGR